MWEREEEACAHMHRRKREKIIAQQLEDDQR